MPFSRTAATMANEAATIRIEFVLDGAGHPKFSDQKLSDGEIRRHYEISRALTSPPEDTWSVTYFLDPSYYNPVRETTGPDFSFETTTYGDYIIQAKIYGKKTVNVLSTNISDALRATYAGTADKETQNAIKTIENN